MDFRQVTQPSNSRPAAPSGAQEIAEHHGHKGARPGSYNLVQVFSGLMLVGIAILIACVALALTRSNDATQKTIAESAYVGSSKYQAVFLSNGQVYFGNIKSMDDRSLRMTGVYYLTQNGDNSSDYSLVKLGCQQIHNPYDLMIINRDQVTFWENLKDDGKVVKSIKEFKQKNPNGPDCSQVSGQTQADSNATTQGGNKK